MATKLALGYFFQCITQCFSSSTSREYFQRPQRAHDTVASSISCQLVWKVSCLLRPRDICGASFVTPGAARVTVDQHAYNLVPGRPLSRCHPQFGQLFSNCPTRRLAHRQSAIYKIAAPCSICFIDSVRVVTTKSATLDR